MADFDLKVTENDGVILVTTNGYLNNYGGEQVASPVSYTHLTLPTTPYV